MEYIKKDLGSYNLHIIKTDRFKTINVRVVFHSPIVKEEITIRNVLCDMFLQSSKKYPSKRDLTIKAQDLYASEIDATNSRFGNYITTSFNLTTLNDKYTEKNNFNNAVEFLSEVIFNPDVENKNFNKDKLEIVKNNARNNINSIKEDATDYSLIRMAEAFNEKQPIAYRMCGYMDDLDKIDTSNLYTYYNKFISKDFVDIFVIGDVLEDDILITIKKYFRFKMIKRKKVPYIVTQEKIRKRRKFANETIDNTQSKLAICNVLDKLSTYERNYPLTLYNIILGGGSDSKLFKKVREENSLCYTIHSVPNKLDNLLLIMAGIDKRNVKNTILLIDKCMLDMRKGKFSDRDIEVAREYFNTAIDETMDSPYRIIDNYLMMELLGTDSLEEKREKMKKVTKKEIMRVAKKVKMDTVFCLEGIKDEGD